MFKLTIFLWIGLIAWNLHISLAQPVTDNYLAHGGSLDGVDVNEITPFLYGIEEQPAGMEEQLTRIASLLTMIASSVKRIPEHFQRLGSRFFYFDPKNPVPFNVANFKCRELGGHLASIRSQEEIDYMRHYIDEDYWLAFNDQAVEGHYVSSVTNKTAPFLKWKLGEPSDKDHTKNCVALYDGLMYNADCNDKKHFICQADDDI